MKQTIIMTILGLVFSLGSAALYAQDGVEIIKDTDAVKFFRGSTSFLSVESDGLILFDFENDGNQSTKTLYNNSGNPIETEIWGNGSHITEYGSPTYSEIFGVQNPFTKLYNINNKTITETFPDSSGNIFTRKISNGKEEIRNSSNEVIKEEDYLGNPLPGETWNNPLTGSTAQFNAEGQILQSSSGTGIFESSRMALVDLAGSMVEVTPNKIESKNNVGNVAELLPDALLFSDTLATGDSTNVRKGEIKIAANGKQLKLNEIGLESNDPANNSDFFADCFGISKLQGSGFVGIGFDANNGNIFLSGNVNISGNISKQGGSFKIDHPLDPTNKWLYHSFVESPDMMNIYNGNITTDANGDASVELPEYFDALNEHFRYQLTVIGSFAQAIIAQEIQNNIFTIKTDQPNVKVSWQVTGIRKDDFAQDNRIPNEVEKTGRDKGKKLYDPNRNTPYSEGLQKHWERRNARVDK